MHYSKRKPLFDPEKVKQAIEKRVKPGTVFEYRAVDATLDDDRREGIVYGFFDNAAALVKELSRVRSAKGQYITANPVNPQLHHRAFNKLKRGRSGDGTGDKDIVRRVWLIVDVDADRLANISAADDEHEAALTLAAKIRAELSAEGWPEPLFEDSGNGGRLNYAIDLPADDGGLVKRILETLDARYSGNGLSIDVTVHSAGQIDKLPGTMCCKGDDTPERPHRMANIIDAPAVVEVVPIELLEALAKEAPQPTAARPQGKGHSRSPNGSFDLEAWIAEHCPDARPPKRTADGDVWVLPVCPWDASHTGGCAHIIRRNDGKIGAACKHNSCAGKGWHELRDAVEPGWRKNSPAPSSTATTANKRPKKIRFVEVAPYTPPPVDVLPEPVCGYIKAAAKALGCDCAYVLLPLVVALAAAVGTTRRIRLKRGWCEPLVVWGGIVGESGTLKSPAVDVATAALQRRQDDSFAHHAKAMETYKRDLALFEADFIEWRNKGRKKHEPPPEKPPEPQPARYIVDDITTEAVIDRLQYNARGLLAVCDELAGWVLRLNQYKGGKGADAAVWLKMHGARAVTNDRKTGAKLIYVRRAGTWIVGGIQPGILRRILTPEHFENGLSARLLLVMPPALPKRWTEATVDEATEDALDFVFDKLLALEFTTTDDGKAKPVDLDLTANGRRVWVAFYNEHAMEQADLAGDLAAAWSKLEGYAARLALLVHLLRWAADDGTLESKNRVDAKSVEAGAALARWLGAEAKRIYAVLGDDPDTAELRQTMAFIQRKGGEVTVRELSMSDRRFRGRVDDAEAELNRLAAAELATWETIPPAGGRGPGRRVCRLSTLSTVNGFAKNAENIVITDDVDAVDAPSPPHSQPDEVSELLDHADAAMAPGGDELGADEEDCEWSA